MPAASTGPPAVGSPRMPRPPPPLSPAATGVVVFSHPASAPSAPAPAAAAPVRRRSDRRVCFEGPFKAVAFLAGADARCQGGTVVHRGQGGLNVRSGGAGSGNEGERARSWPAARVPLLSAGLGVIWTP